jgi:hypothetical protein
MVIGHDENNIGTLAALGHRGSGQTGGSQTKSGRFHEISARMFFLAHY